MATGEAAGTAAALSITENVTPRKLSAKKVRTALSEKGVKFN